MPKEATSIRLSAEAFAQLDELRKQPIYTDRNNGYIIEKLILATVVKPAKKTKRG